MASPRPCIVPGCDGDRGRRQDYCDAHYQRVRALGHPDFDRPIIRRQRQPDECTVEGCKRKPKCKGVCSTHYARLRVGDLRPTEQIRTPAPAGSGWIDDNGYRRIGGRPEHRLVMEAHLGRRLAPDESVHHKNGVRHDNRLENLELWVARPQPPGQRVDDRVEDAVATLERYAPHLLARL